MIPNLRFDIIFETSHDSRMSEVHQLPVRLDDETYRHLKLVAESTHRPMSKLIQEAVADLLERESRRLAEELSPRVEKLRQYANRAGARAAALAAVANAEAAHGKDDPAEGTRIGALGDESTE
jgi:predicted DNA-binding protein